MQRLDWERWRLPRRGLLARARKPVRRAWRRPPVLTELGRAPRWQAIKQDDGTPGPEEGRLLARPGQPTETASPGLHALGLDRDRDALLLVPAGYRADQPAPFVLSLHGAGGDATSGLYPLRDLADEAGLILLSPASRQSDVGRHSRWVWTRRRLHRPGADRCLRALRRRPGPAGRSGILGRRVVRLVTWYHQR